MAELNLKQITDKLNSEFNGEVRKLVFWYDADAEFVDDVDTLELVNAKVLHLAQDNQFYTKYFLECVDTTTNYLVYAPFAKPAIRENHLADTIKYSIEFFADRASLVMLDLGLDERLKPTIEHYKKFFDNRKRIQPLYDLDVNLSNQKDFEIALMSVLCKCKTPSYEEVLRKVLTDAGFEDNPYLAEFEKYDLLNAFWTQAQDLFGYADEKPTLEKFTMTVFVTYAAKYITAEMPMPWQPFISFKGGNIIAFLDNLMNSYIYGERFDEISRMVYDSLNAEEELKKLPRESLVTCGIFAGIDELLIDWALQRLELEDVSAKLGDITIPQFVKMRRQMHFGRAYRNEYLVLENAHYIIAGSKYEDAATFDELIKKYTDDLYNIDQKYRCFYYYLDKLEDSGRFDKLRELVENIYANEYLAKVTLNWNQLYEGAADIRTPKQVEFFSNNIQYAKDQVVVIISDAMRYEVGMSLLGKLNSDEKCNAQMSTMLSTLPSFTPYGMAALLPHKSLEITENYDIIVDGQKNGDIAQRQTILQNYKPDSKCVQYDTLKNMSVADLRGIFTRQDVVYIYHNQIDARGDKASTENEVFNACEEAIEEIHALVKRLTTSANKSHFFITSDHGFMYRRNKLTESDKISSVTEARSVKGRRYLLADSAPETEGVASCELGKMLNTNEPRVVCYPMGADVFKVPGAGINYVHGGCSPQEMLVPLIEVKTEKGFKETSTVKIALVSLTPKITNLITSLDFVQTEAISDVVKETTYRIYFVDSSGEKISNEHIYVADKKDKDTMNRVFKLRFSFKNKKYDKTQKYYLIAVDTNNDLEVVRQEMVIDIALADDFGFGF